MAIKSYTPKIGSKSQKNNAGRPTVLTPEVVSILVTSFQNGMNVREACWQAVISHEAYYKRVREDDQFTDIMARAQAEPTMNARRVIAGAINNGDISASKWWLERKASEEFGSNPRPIKESTEEALNPFTAMSDEELVRLGLELNLFGKEVGLID